MNQHHAYYESIRDYLTRDGQLDGDDGDPEHLALRAAPADPNLTPMRYSAHLTAVPYGSAAGEPCIEIATDVPTSYEDARARIAKILSAAAGLHGIASYWLPSAPWGEEGCDAGLLPMLEGIATVRACVDVFADHATALMVTQIVDATRLLGGVVVEPAALRMQLASRMRVPRAEEVVVLQAHEQNLTAAHLDVVTEFLATAGVEPVGYLYVPPQRLEAALMAVAKASSVWRVACGLMSPPRLTLVDVQVGAGQQAQLAGVAP